MSEKYYDCITEIKKSFISPINANSKEKRSN